jgi:hypothetical protein
MDTISQGDTVWMTSLDEYGFCGREYHPERADLGLTAEVISVHTHEDINEDGDCSYTVLKCLTHGNEPKFLELMDFEVTRL